MDMKTRGRTDVCLVLCGILIWFLADSVRVRAAAASALTLCAHTVIPALFPFLVISSLLISLGFGQWLSPYLAGIMVPLFRLPGQASSALLLGLVGGYPIGTKTAVELYQQGQLTADEARRLLTFCNNSNPVFLISVLGSGIFHSFRAGIWLWLIHLLSALLTGLLFRGGKKPVSRRHTHYPVSAPPSFVSAFVESVRGAATGMLSLCAFVVLFYVLASPLTALENRAAIALVGLLELFSLTPLLPPDTFGFILAAGYAGWGGLSVLCQTAAALEGTGLPLRPALLGKATQGVLSALLAALLAPFVLN